MPWRRAWGFWSKYWQRTIDESSYRLAYRQLLDAAADQPLPLAELDVEQVRAAIRRLHPERGQGADLWQPKHWLDSLMRLCRHSYLSCRPALGSMPYLVRLAGTWWPCRPNLTTVGSDPSLSPAWYMRCYASCPSLQSRIGMLNTTASGTRLLPAHLP